MNYQLFDSWLIERAKAMPHLRGDRAAQSAAAAAQNQAGQTAATLGGNAQGIFGPLTSFASNEMTAPPGYGTALPGMEATAGEAGSAASNTAQEQATLRAANTRNAAGLTANQDAIAQSAARGTGQNIQDILAQNAQLQQQQVGQGAGILQGIYGTDVGAANAAAGQQAGDINSETNAGNSGWLQNLTGILGSLGSLGTGVGNASKVCWVAAELYGGWLKPETIAVRDWILDTWYMAPFAWIYRRCGERWARCIRTNAVMRTLTKSLFNAMLRKARA